MGNSVIALLALGIIAYCYTLYRMVVRINSEPCQICEARTHTAKDCPQRRF